ncbi:MAG: HAMP domain-containing histidine kinase [Bacteroidales bacterium]|nr:HAMP domain-containing histidine kinase [Bacteroidales bacterium]
MAQWSREILNLLETKTSVKFIRTEMGVPGLPASEIGVNAEIEALKNAEVAQLKQRFFTNISHEFRTPLTLISGPINKLISIAKENQAGKEVLKYYHLIERNVNRLTELTNQLLDFRKIETGSMRIDIHHGDVVRFIRGINERFMQLAESKQIDFQFSSTVISGEGLVRYR